MASYFFMQSSVELGDGVLKKEHLLSCWQMCVVIKHSRADRINEDGLLLFHPLPNRTVRDSEKKNITRMNTLKKIYI